MWWKYVSSLIAHLGTMKVRSAIRNALDGTVPQEVKAQGTTKPRRKKPDYDNFVGVQWGGGCKSRLIVGRCGGTNEKAITAYSCGLPPWQPWWKQQGVTQSSCFGAADSDSFNSNWARRPYSNYPIVPPSFARAQFFNTSLHINALTQCPQQVRCKHLKETTDKIMSTRTIQVFSTKMQT